MNALRLAIRPILVAAATAALAACASPPAKQTDMDYRSRPSEASRASSPSPGSTGSSGQRLTIQSGEGERLNLPWFIQDTQNWINSN